jgi:hypothetical protein
VIRSRILLVITLAATASCAGLEPISAVQGVDAGHTDSGPVDAGASDAGLDGGVADGGPCARLLAEATQIFNSDQSCTANTDCTVTSSACGLPGECGGVINQSGGAPLQSVAVEWNAADCWEGAGLCPDCPAFYPGLLCENGTCEAAAGAGEACSRSTDCAQAPDPQYHPTCLTGSPWTNGYCVQPCSDGFGCPTEDTVCRQLPTGENACLQRCEADSDCRTTEGYQCCTLTGGSGGVGKTCAPAPC